MSYEWVVVFHHQFAGTLAAADHAWADDTYHKTSRPLADESARKWRLYNALAAANPGLRQNGSVVAEDPETGTEKTLPCLLVMDNEAGDGVSFHVFDDAVEILLPEALYQAAPEAVAGKALDYFNALASVGFSVVYDVDEGVLLDPAKDFDALVARYKATLDYFAQEQTENEERNSTPAGQPIDAAPVKSGGFAGNVGESKPWWKFW